MQPPLQPSYVLRGHTAALHALCFFRNNTRLLSGDSEGWTIVWDTTTKRPAAVWRAHSATILGLAAWDDDKIITHGRDGKLNVWQFTADDEVRLSKDLPVDNDGSERASPWILHSLPVHTLNFCSFAWCHNGLQDGQESILVAVPSADETSILLYQLPQETIHAKISTGPRTEGGMLMAITLSRDDNALTTAAAFEVGIVSAWRKLSGSHQWTKIFSSKSHSQPTLSLQVMPDYSAWYSSGADATLAKYPADGTAEVVSQTKHAGQQGLQVRSDGRLLATAGWDGRARIYSTRTLQEVAVLKWHKEGCYALAFAQLGPLETEDEATELGNNMVKRETSMTVARKRQAKVQDTHWLALGSKDGKISLWDVF